jgi:uncharacterized protein Veg
MTVTKDPEVIEYLKERYGKHVCFSSDDTGKKSIKPAGRIVECLPSYTVRVKSGGRMQKTTDETSYCYIEIAADVADNISQAMLQSALENRDHYCNGQKNYEPSWGFTREAKYRNMGEPEWKTSLEKRAIQPRNEGSVT